MESQLVTVYFVRQELQTARTALLDVSHADSSQHQLKAPKFALVLAKIELIPQKTLLVGVKQDLTSIPPKV